MLTHGGGGCFVLACDWSQDELILSEPRLQQENETFEDFSRRTDTLAVRLGLSVQDLPAVTGFSRASLFAYRSGKRPISSKSWRKLEHAERLAGISPAGQVAAAENAGSSGNPKDPPPQPGKKVSSEMDPLQTLQAQVAAIQARLDATFSPIQKIVSEFPMEELISRMQAANAWPPSPEDGKLSPALLMLKYAPPTCSIK